MCKLIKFFYPCIVLIVVCNNSYSKEDTPFPEACYLENSYVLLYKIINWWNDSVDGDSSFICNNNLLCEVKGQSHITVNNQNNTISIGTSSHIEDLISIFKECSNCTGPSHLKCTYINANYFGNIPLSEVALIGETINSLTITGVPSNKASSLRQIEEKISIQVEGVIGGLLIGSSKIALHQSGYFLKECANSQQNENIQSQTLLTIKNVETDEILAKYKMIIE